LAIKLAVTPLSIGAASLAGRRWGHQVGGWLVALPLTSGPVAFFLATDHGAAFAGNAAVGMLAGTISQVGFALAYRCLGRRGWGAGFAAGSVAFAVMTLGLAHLRWTAVPTFLLVIAAIALAYGLTRRSGQREDGAAAVAAPPPWDIPVRMIVATGVVVAITALAPAIGPRLAGLLSPFPVFGAVVAVFTHQSHGHAAAASALDGLIMGLAAPAVFFLALALGLPTLGLSAFALATVAALITHAGTLFAVPSSNTAFSVGTTTSAPTGD
jgi:hypothetical protein